MAKSLAWLMFTYLGWNAAIYIAGEIRDPPRLLPRCLIGGCLLVTLLYLAINVTYGYALDPRIVAEMALDTVPWRASRFP
ncbi:MAG: amino acid permease [Proteobacteria bacterium]|nr:amino acid permease [Pseudomonadota bacterium]